MAFPVLQFGSHLASMAGDLVEGQYGRDIVMDLLSLEKPTARCAHTISCMPTRFWLLVHIFQATFRCPGCIGRILPCAKCTSGVVQPFCLLWRRDILRDLVCCVAISLQGRIADHAVSGFRRTQFCRSCSWEGSQHSWPHFFYRSWWLEELVHNHVVLTDIPLAFALLYYCNTAVRTVALPSSPLWLGQWSL